MTLLLAIANAESAVLVSDRRLLHDGELVDDEAAKLTTFVCDDGRFAVGFTGLGHAGDFSTEDWLVEALAEAAAASGHRIELTVAQLADMATATFAELAGDPGLRLVPSARRLSIAFVGFHHGEFPPRAYCILVSNCDGLGEVARPTADATFGVTYARMTGDRAPGLAVAISPDDSVPPRRLKRLLGLARAQSPAEALCGRAVGITRRAAEDGLAGSRPTSVSLPVNPAHHVVALHHRQGRLPQLYLPNHVVSTHAVATSFRGITLGALDAEGRPRLAIPSVCRNGDCPCASGHKYKRCHGLSPGTPGFGYPHTRAD